MLQTGRFGGSVCLAGRKKGHTRMDAHWTRSCVQREEYKARGKYRREFGEGADRGLSKNVSAVRHSILSCSVVKCSRSKAERSLPLQDTLSQPCDACRVQRSNSE